MMKKNKKKNEPIFSFRRSAKDNVRFFLAII